MKERASSFEIRRFLIFFLCIFIVAAGTDCMLLALEKPCTDTEEKSEDAVLAEVDGERITLEDFEPRMQSISGYDNSGSATQRDRNRKALESHLKTCLFAVAAKDGKLDQNETVRKRLEDAKRAILAVEYTKRLHSSKKSEVTNREIKTYYNAHKNEFSRPAMVRARHILIRVDPGAGPSEISAALKRAKKVKKELEDGADFTELVKIYSDDGGTKNQGGDLGFITENRTDQAFTDAVFSLKPGELSEPVRARRGFHIIKVETKREAKLIPLPAVHGRIRAKIANERQMEREQIEYERLKKKYNVKIFEENLDRIKLKKSG